MLRTWHPVTGVPMVSFGDRILKTLGVYSVGWDFTGGAQSGTFTDARLTQYPGCVGSVFSITPTFDTRGGGVRLSISGNTVTWAYPYPEATQAKRPNNTFVLGIY